MALPEIGKQGDYNGEIPSPKQENECHYFATEKSSIDENPTYLKNRII
jgi:hypothetical protein